MKRIILQLRRCSRSEGGFYMVSLFFRTCRNQMRRIAVEINCPAFYCLVLFVILNTVKIAVFNHVIVENGSLQNFSDFFCGIVNKLIIIGVCTAILLRVRWRILTAGFYVAQTVYILINLMYYLSFHSYLHISQYSGLFQEAFDLLTHAALPWDARSLFVIIDLPFCIVVLFAYRRLFELNKKYFFRPVMYCSSALFLVAFYKWEIPVETPLRMMNNAYESDETVVKKYGLLTFTLLDMFNYGNAYSNIKKLNYGPRVIAPDTGNTHPNVLIIQVESLDSRIVDYRYKKTYVAPFIHDLSSRCVFFPYLLSYHLAGSTSDCEFSTINSVEPLSDFPSIKIRDYDYPNSLLKRCAEEGYSTVAFHGNRGTYFNRSSAFKRMGFQKFYDMFAMGLPEIGWGASDESVFDFIKSQMVNQKPPFLYYCITMSSHEPFIFVKQYYRNSTFDDIKDGPLRNYLNSMSYVDKVLRKFISSALASCPNTVVIIYGDHTPTLPKCGYSKSSTQIRGQLFEFVPLFIISPGKTIYQEKRYAASFLDIAPTVLTACRCRSPIRSYGIDLLSLPTTDKEIPFRLNVYSRKMLYDKIRKSR
jgi:lipoteichoic acid synthase